MFVGMGSMESGNTPAKAERKRMSKGCLIALIVVGVLLVMAVVAGVVCYMNRDQLAKFGVTTMVNQVKQRAAEDPQAGVDTVQVNRIADLFLARFEADEDVDLDKIGSLLKDVQMLSQKDVLDSTDVLDFREAVFDFYPDLRDSLPLEVVGDTATVTDTAAIGTD